MTDRRPPNLLLIWTDEQRADTMACYGNSFYDLNNDPHELENRIDDPAYRAPIADLTARIQVWQRATGDDAAGALTL